MNINELQVRLNEKLNRQEEILNVADAEQRDFNETEKSEFDTLTRDVNALTGQIQAEQAKDEARAKIAMAKMNTAKKSEDAKVAQKFSFVRALNQLSRGVHPDNLTGAEGEMHQEGVREARSAGRSVMGFAMPGIMMRAQTAGTPATAGNMIATELDSTIIPALRPRTVIAGLGATQMNGLVGNLDQLAGDGISTATWSASENVAATNTDPSTRLVSLRPSRLDAKTVLSKQLLVQASFDAEAWVRSELENAIARAVDAAAIQGNGAEIDGVLGTSGVNDITFGGAVTRAKLVNLMTKIETENADAARMSYLMHPIIKGELMNLKTDTGSGLFVMQDPNSLLGFNVAVSTLVPTDIAGSKTAVLFGDWTQLILANWGGVDITVDPYSLADNAQVKVVVNSYWDVKLKQPKAFAFGNDITWTALS